MYKTLGLVFLWAASITIASAFNVVSTEVSRPYDVVSIVPNESDQVLHLGKLDGFPVMYEFTLEEAAEIPLQLGTLANGTSDGMFTLMVIRVNDDGSGVTEIARQAPKEGTWTVHKEAVFGLTFSKGEVLTLPYEPGTYRVEVSTPVNEGAYVLAVGNATGYSGYFSMLSHIHAVQKHFGFSIVRMIGSSYVYYSLGILLLLFAFHRTWKLRDKISHA